MPCLRCVSRALRYQQSGETLTDDKKGVGCEIAKPPQAAGPAGVIMPHGLSSVTRSAKVHGGG